MAASRTNEQIFPRPVSSNRNRASSNRNRARNSERTAAPKLWMEPLMIKRWIEVEKSDTATPTPRCAASVSGLSNVERVGAIYPARSSGRAPPLPPVRQRARLLRFDRFKRYRPAGAISVASILMSGAMVTGPG
jgi:hypothetical protein